MGKISGFAGRAAELLENGAPPRSSEIMQMSETGWKDAASREKGRKNSLAEEILGAVTATAALAPAPSATAFRWERRKTERRCISDRHLWWSSQAPFITIREKWVKMKVPFSPFAAEGVGWIGPWEDPISTHQLHREPEGTG